MIVIVAGFILAPADFYLDNGHVGKQPVAWKECCVQPLVRRQTSRIHE